MVFRLSGTGSQGATIRVYFEKYEAQQVTLPHDLALQQIIQQALHMASIEEFTGRTHPTVVT